jgi:hypothetical protein
LRILASSRIPRYDLGRQNPSFLRWFCYTLAHPTPCILIITISGDYQMEVGKGIVYPKMYTLDDVPINSVSFDVVKVDMVHENVKNLNLEVAPDDTTLTLWDTVTKRVQWRRTSIDVDLAAISASTTPSLS